MSVRRRIATGLLLALVAFSFACQRPEPLGTEESVVKIFGFGWKTAQGAIPELDREVPPEVRTATFAVG